MIVLDTTCGSMMLRSSNSDHRKLQRIHSYAETIPGSYIVMFHKDQQNRRQLAGRSLSSAEEMDGIIVQHEFVHVLEGAIAIENVTDDVLFEILEDPNVKKVVPVRTYLPVRFGAKEERKANNLLLFTTGLSFHCDSFVIISFSFVSFMLQNSYGEWSFVPQLDPVNWGIDRIDQANLPLDDLYYPKYNGSGVNVYAVDSGYQNTHPEFVNTNISCGIDIINADPTLPCSDTYGHGTMVAGLVAGGTVGVARGVNLISVKVGINKNIQPTIAAVIAGVEWITSQKLLNRKQPMVAVISIAFMTDDGDINLIDVAVNRMIAAGVTTVTGAGNFAEDACYTTPARVVNAITVGGTDMYDTVWNESNYGPCVDIFAPSVNLTFPWRKSQYITDIGGTSMAAPLVAGIAAMHLQLNPRLLPVGVWRNIRSNATRSILHRPLEETWAWFPRTRTQNLMVKLGSALTGNYSNLNGIQL